MLPFIDKVASVLSYAITSRIQQSNSVVQVTGSPLASTKLIFLALLKSGEISGNCICDNFPSLSKVAIPFAIPKFGFAILMLLMYTQNGGQH